MAQLSKQELLRYGALGMPLALVALPVYVYVPQFYAQHFALSLTTIGTALLAVRLLDAFIDPAIGLTIDRSRGRIAFFHWISWAALPLIVGFIALFRPPVMAGSVALWWMVASLAAVYFGFSLATIAHQSWGAALTQEPLERTRLVATREGCGLAGVLLAAVLPAIAGIEWLLVFFVAALCVTTLLLMRAPVPARDATHLHGSAASSLLLPFQDRHFRWLFGVFVLNGIAAAIPATLFLFFAEDRLQLGGHAGLFLLLYFAAAAMSMPLWVAIAKRWGDARAWLVGMLLAIAAFIWAALVPPQALAMFGLICAMSGIALGADLALPPALLAGVIRRAGHENRHEGAYFGTWNWTTKLNLALAAGIALPVLERLGYTPGAGDADALDALAYAYALLPCMLKAGAAVLLWRAPLRDV
jgi:GPH family glycoside/pentoside/hexuronide:cation symporter